MKYLNNGILVWDSDVYQRVSDNIIEHNNTPYIVNSDKDIMDAYWESLCEGAVEYVRKWVGTIWISNIPVIEYYYDYKPTDTEVATAYRKMGIADSITVTIESKVVLIEH